VSNWFSDLIEKAARIDPLFKGLKDATYKGIEFDSQGMESLGRRMGWDWLVQEGQRNQKNPGRAAGKAAQTAATWYLGGPAWSGASEAGTAAQLAAQQAAATSAYSGLGATGGGMFGQALGQTAASVANEGAKTAAEIAAEEAAKQAAQQAAQQSVGQAATTQPGMFNMVPGVTQGSPQHLAILEQNAGMGGSASDLTAQAARGALSNKQGLADSFLNTAKADLAGMNDPTVWMDRLGRNASRFAATNGKDFSRNMLMQSLQGGGGQPQRGPAPPPPQQQQQTAPPPDMYGGTTSGEIERLIAQLSDEDKRRLLASLGR